MQLLRIKIHKKGAVPIKRRRREKFDIMKPYKLQRWVEITTNVGCSNMCLYCPQKKLIKTYFAEKRPANMSFRMFKKYLRQIPKKMDICFTGLSEPLLNKDAIKMIKYASEKGYNVHLYTTFRNASLKEIKSLKNIEIKTFVIHLPDKNNLMTLQVNEEYLKKLDLFQKFDFSNVTYMCIGEVHPDIKRIIKTDIQESPVNFRAGNVEKQNYEKIKNSNVILMDSCFKEYRTEQKVICNRRFLYRGKDEAVTLPEATILLPDGSFDFMLHGLGNGVCIRKFK